jgi:hypothetical protein
MYRERIWIGFAINNPSEGGSVFEGVIRRFGKEAA